MSEFQGMYAIFDKKMNNFQSVFVVPNDAVAIRSLSDFLKSPNGSLLSQHPEDFVLFKVGVWSPENGITAIDKAVVCSCADFSNTEKLNEV